MENHVPDAMFAHHIPADVVATYDELPEGIEDTEVNRALASKFVISGEYLNIALGLTREDWYEGFDHKEEIEDNKNFVKDAIQEIHSLLQDAGEGAFGVPADQIAVFEYFGLSYPPVDDNEDDEEEDANGNGA